MIGVPKGIRTPVTAVKGRCPRPLDDGDAVTAAQAFKAASTENQPPCSVADRIAIGRASAPYSGNRGAADVYPDAAVAAALK